MPERGSVSMPPPPLPSSATRSRSRNTNNTGDTAMSVSSPASSVASSPKSSTLSETTKFKLRELSGDECWACSSAPAQVCHVFVKEDRQIDAWLEQDLIDFPLGSIANAIALCGVCHPQFDCAADPGFAFIPTDLDYFIDFELQNRQRRNDAALEGVDLKRQVPAPEMYKKHQIVTGEVAADAIGGRYHPVFLKRYMHRRLPFDLMTYFTVPKEWHGAPLACIRRCLPLLGSPRLRDIPTRRKLERLLSLYFFAEDENPPAALLEGGGWASWP